MTQHNGVRQIEMLFVSACALWGTGGCGTIANVRSHEVVAPPPGQVSIFEPGRWDAPKEIYGGAKLSHNFGMDLIKDSEDVGTFAIGLVALVVDLPLSVAGDTLTLPITVPSTLDRKSQSGVEPDSIPESGNNDTTSGADVAP